MRPRLVQGQPARPVSRGAGPPPAGCSWNCLGVPLRVRACLPAPPTPNHTSLAHRTPIHSYLPLPHPCSEEAELIVGLLEAQLYRVSV